MKFGRRVSLTLEILGLALGIVTIILGFNEATADILDRIGSNYWLAYCAIISGAAIIIIVLVLSKRQARKQLMLEQVNKT
jgi:ABC-type Fe3+-siderophore transport system permease subunit